MTKMLAQAFEEASKLPDDEQDSLAAAVLDALAAERRWEQLFDASSDLLSELAGEALSDFRAGRTEQLEPDAL